MFSKIRDSFSDRHAGGLSGAGKMPEKDVREFPSDFADEEGADKPLSDSLPSKELNHV